MPQSTRRTALAGAAALPLAPVAAMDTTADNTLMPLQLRLRSLELNPVENFWQSLRDNWLSNRVFQSYEDLVAVCRQAWSKLVERPWKIISIGMRKWAHAL